MGSYSLPVQKVRHTDVMCSEMYGGRVCQHYSFWKTICADKYVLSLVRGVKILFIDDKPPVQTVLPCELCMSAEEMEFVDDHLQQLVSQGFVQPLERHIPHGWVSNIFLVPKKTRRFQNDT